MDERCSLRVLCVAMGVVDSSGAVCQDTRAGGAKQAQGLQKAMQPGTELAAIVGREPLPRTKITKKLWDYPKAHGLQDTQNTRQIHAADAMLEPVFGGKKSTSMFKLAKLVTQHAQSAYPVWLQ
jgi:upstream activation factor subunit UAF30